MSTPSRIPAPLHTTRKQTLIHTHTQTHTHTYPPLLSPLHTTRKQTQSTSLCFTIHNPPTVSPLLTCSHHRAPQCQIAHNTIEVSTPQTTRIKKYTTQHHNVHTTVHHTMPQNTRYHTTPQCSHHRARPLRRNPTAERWPVGHHGLSFEVEFNISLSRGCETIGHKTHLVSRKILKGGYFEVFSFPLLSAHVTPTGCLGNSESESLGREVLKIWKLLLLQKKYGPVQPSCSVRLSRAGVEEGCQA